MIKFLLPMSTILHSLFHYLKEKVYTMKQPLNYGDCFMHKNSNYLINGLNSLKYIQICKCLIIYIAKKKIAKYH
jgi:hypothetical protein